MAARAALNGGHPVAVCGDVSPRCGVGNGLVIARFMVLLAHQAL